jgi:hypothetical protein
MFAYIPIHLHGADQLSIALVSCIAGEGNENRYMIATQDPALMKRLAAIPAVPVVTVMGHRPVLLKPTRATDRAAKTVCLHGVFSCQLS